MYLNIFDATNHSFGCIFWHRLTKSDPKTTHPYFISPAFFSPIMYFRLHLLISRPLFGDKGLGCRVGSDLMHVSRPVKKEKINLDWMPWVTDIRNNHCVFVCMCTTNLFLCTDLYVFFSISLPITLLFMFVWCFSIYFLTFLFSLYFFFCKSKKTLWLNCCVFQLFY